MENDWWGMHSNTMKVSGDKNIDRINMLRTIYTLFLFFTTLTLHAEWWNPDVTVGKIQTSTTFNFETLDYKIQIPAGWKYSIARRDMKYSPGTIDVLIDEKIISKNMVMNWFDGNDLSITFRSFFKEQDMQKVIDSHVERNKYSETQDIYIDGKLFKATLIGTEELASLHFYFKTKRATHWVWISNISRKNQKQVDRLLASIEILDVDSDYRKTRSIVPFTSKFNMAEESDVEFDDITLPVYDQLGFTCEWSKLGLEVHFPGEMSNYTLFFEGQTTSFKPPITTLPQIMDQTSVYSKAGDPVALWIAKTDTVISAVDYAKLLYRSYNAYTMMDILKKGVVEANDRQWSIIICRWEDYYSAYLRSREGEYVLDFTINTPTEEELYKYCAIIQSVKRPYH
jgi:hypothetical protein